MAEPFDGFAVFSVLIANQHHAVNRQFRRVQRRQCQQRVVHCPQRAARRYDHRQLEFHHEVEHKLLLVDRYQHASGPLYDQPVVDQAVGHADAPEVDFHSCPARREIGRNRRYKFVHFIERSVRANPRQPHHRHPV